MLKNLDSNLWIAEQSQKYLGLEVGTRMTVIRLDNHKIIIISPIKITDALAKQIDQIGEVEAIIAPNLYHHLFVNQALVVYPQAKLYAVPGLLEKCPDLPIDSVLDPDYNQWSKEIEYIFFDGVRTFDGSRISPLNEFVFFHQSSKTLIITDVAFNFDASFPWTTQLVGRILDSYKQLNPTRLEKWATIDKTKVKRSVELVLNWDFQRVIMAHGSIVEQQAKQQFKQAYKWV